MQIDVHVHACGWDITTGRNQLCPPERRSVMLRHYVARLTRLQRQPGGIRARMNDWMQQSRLDRFALLALDAAHHADGTADLGHTRLAIDNDFVADWAAVQPKALFGASVHPRRPDALAELERLAGRGACLVKWLPSAQNILPDDPAHLPFFDKLVELRLPLLSHTGVEHTLSAFPDDLNAPRRLRPALERGVTVIAAHCGTRLFLHEHSYFEEWCRLALEFPNCYGDISSFGLPLHGQARRAILRDPALTGKILFGSDFPAHVFPWWFLAPLGLRRWRALQALANPFDRAARLMTELGVPAAAFTRAAQLLRLPEAAP